MTMQPPSIAAAGRDARHRALLDRARQIAAGELAPRAGETDQAALLPARNLSLLAGAGLLGLTTPEEHGGAGAPPEVVRAFLEIIAAACGVTIFVAFQHLVACRHIAGGENEGLKQALLPRLSAGKRFCTLAFSHLRRPGPPMVRVEPDGDGYRFEGTAPWCTGIGLADEVLLAGHLADGRSVWVVAPLGEGAALEPGAPMRLCAMEASATVFLACRGLRVGPERVVKTMTPEQLAADTGNVVLFFSALSLGAAVGAVRVLRSAAEARGSAVLATAAELLEQETEQARSAVAAAAATAGTVEYAGRSLRARAWCVDLGVRAAHAAVTAAGGSANLRDHPAQRLFREAMCYTLTAQVPDLQAATLDRLVRPAPLPSD